MICPICKKEFEGKIGDKYFPFDKEFCKNLDLYSWFHEEYIISEPISKYRESGEEEAYNIKGDENGELD